MKEIKSFAETWTLELYISQHLIFLKEKKRPRFLDSNIILCIHLFQEGKSALVKKMCWSQRVGLFLSYTASSHCKLINWLDS